MSDQIAHHVLVIDDDEAIGQEICETLALKNFSGHYVENIRKAKEQLAKDSNLGIVVVDYHMPEMNGIELIQRLKNESPHRLAFIVLTGDDTQATAIEAVKAQAFDFLRKPFTGPLLTASVRRASEHLDRLQETDRRNALLATEAEVLKDRVASITKMLNHRESLLDKLLFSDRSLLDVVDQMQAGRGRASEDSGNGHEGEFAPLECAPVNMSALLYRILPAIEEMSVRKRIKFKARVPNNLPFLCGDEKRLMRAMADVSACVVNELAKDDRLTIIAMKDARELIINLRVKSSSFSNDFWDVFTKDMASAIDHIDEIDVPEMKLFGTRIVVHLHGGRIAIEQEPHSEWVLRMFFPLSSVETAH
jgi:FixJ family two-component response regulator